MQSLIRSKSAGVTGGRGTAGAGPGRDPLYCCLFLMSKMFFLLKYNQSRIAQARDKQVEENQDQSMNGCSVNSER